MKSEIPLSSFITSITRNKFFFASLWFPLGVYLIIFATFGLTFMYLLLSGYDLASSNFNRSSIKLVLLMPYPLSFVIALVLYGWRERLLRSEESRPH